MKKILATLLACLALLPLCGCEQAKEIHFTALDTVITVKTRGCSHAQDSEELVRAWENILSATRDDSEISRLNRGEITEVSAEVSALLAEGQKISAKTGGAFDMTLGSLTDLWDIQNATAVPSSAQIAQALSHCGYENLAQSGTSVTLQNGAQIDLGAIGKGYILGKLIEHLKAGGGYGTVSVGGNVGVFGKKPNGSAFRIAMRDPADGDGFFAYLNLCSGYVSTSGSYERYAQIGGVTYSHIFDPHTGYPVENDLLCAIVISENGADGDALSTALFVMGLEKALDFCQSGQTDFEAILVDRDGNVYTTDPDALELADSQTYRIKEIS